MDRLKELHDAGANDFDNLFSRKTLEATSVIALDQLEADIVDLEERHLRLEDIPASQILKFEQPEAPPELVEKVRQVLCEAQKAAAQAAAECFKSAPRDTDSNRIRDVSGWAHLFVLDAQTPLISALLQLEAVFPVAGSGYCFHNICGLGEIRDPALCLAEAEVKAAKSVFEKHFPNALFTMETRWD